VAHQRGYDLVEVAGSSFPPVCRLLDFGKYKYKLDKEERKSKAKTLGVKELRFKLTIEPHDLEVKKAKIKQFLNKGHKVKVTLILKGREMAYKQKAYEFLSNFPKSLEGNFAVEGNIKKLGNRFSTTLVKKS